MTRFCTLLVCVVPLLIPTVAPAGEKADRVTDDWCGFTITVGEPWQRGALRDYQVPGALRCAWAGPKGASVVIFLQEPGSAVSPRAILEATVTSQKDQLGAKASVQEVRAVAGMQAMWMVTTGKGTGSLLDGKGDVETTQHWVVVPRERDVVALVMTSRADEYAGLRKSFEAAVATLKLTGSQTAGQKGAK